MHFEVDDAIFRDPRFMKLIAKLGDGDKALGACVSAWIVSFEFWKNGSKPIPRQAWLERCLSDALIEVGLARIVEDGAVYVCGSERIHAWYHKRVNAGRKGGLESQRKKSSTARAKPSKRKQTQPSYSFPSPYPYPDSSPGPEITNAPHSTQAAPDVPPEDRLRRVVAVWCSEYKRRYQVQYRVTGKDAGILKRLLGGVGSVDTMSRIIAAYLDMPDPWFVNKRHDVVTLEANLAKVSQYEQSGQIVTQAQIRDLDRKTTHQAILEKARKGEI